MAKPRKPRFIANASIYDIAETAGVVPEIIPLLPASPFSGRDGRGPFDFTFETLQAAFLANAADLPVDFGHASLSEAERSEPTPVAGWIYELVQSDDGSVWGKVKWTDRAKSHIAAQEFRYISPVFYAPKGQIERLLGAGLVSMPNLYMPSLNSEELPAGEVEAQEEATAAETATVETPAEPVVETPAVEATEPTAEAVAAEPTEGSALEAAPVVEAPIASEEASEPVVETPPAVENEISEETSMLTRITEALGLAADATVDAVLEALATLKASAEAAASAASAAVADLGTPPAEAVVAQSASLEDLEAMTAKYSEATSQVEAMRAQVETAQAEVVAMRQRAETAESRLAAFESEQHAAQIAAAVDTAISSGKFAPSMRTSLEAMARADFSAFQEAVKNAPVLAVVATPVAIRKDESSHGLTPAQLETCQRQGIKPETYAKWLARFTSTHGN